MDIINNWRKLKREDAEKLEELQDRRRSAKSQDMIDKTQREIDLFFNPECEMKKRHKLKKKKRKIREEELDGWL